jgi:hypothetical protein
MMVVLLIAGIGFLLAGLLGIVFGIPVKEFSFGNTLIVTGAIAACTGMIMLGLWTVVRELKNITRQLGGGLPEGARDGATRSASFSAALGNRSRESGGSLFGRDQSAAETAGEAEPGAQSSPLPWHAEATSRDRARNEAPAAPEAADATPAPKSRRNLLFSSSLRKERERAQTRTADPSAMDLPTAPVAAPPPFEADEAPPATFDDAWPRPERSKPADKATETLLPRRSGRVPSTFTEAGAGAAGADRHPTAPRNEDQPPPVTVLKSGVVDGMAYSLYSDGSIEAQMPEGMMRFASIDELRAHLDQRP